jgi:predicted RND superfamily exporter protein
MILGKVTRFSVRRPKLVIALTVLATLAFASQFPRVKLDTDPKHMLPDTAPVRQFNDLVEKEFALHADVIAVGVVNPAGVFNADTLTRIDDLSRKIEAIPGVVSRDVSSLATVDDVSASGGELIVRPVLEHVPTAAADLAAVRASILANPLFVGRIVSADATASVIYVPIEANANGKTVADEIRKVLPAGTADQYYLAGDPVARDTFGSEMLRQMAVFAPAAGMLMCIALWFMFRSITTIVAHMAVAMISVICAMGLLIGLGIPVHLMSSMAPVFIMAICTDAVHISNEYELRLGHVKDKATAVVETLDVVGRPIFLSDLLTAIGFAALATAPIVPVKIFGLVVGFGSLILLITSFTLVPALLVLMPGHARAEPAENAAHGWLQRLGELTVRRPKTVSVVTFALIAVSVVGLGRIRVNNNMFHWFLPASPIRTADRVMNEHLGGTSTGYLVVDSPTEDAIKDPAVLRSIEAVQRELEKDPRVGKTFSVVDYVKRINFVLHDNDPAFDRIPDTATEVGQYLFLFSLSAKPSDLDNVVDYPYRKANIFLQLKTWDTGTMRDAVSRVDTFVAAHPIGKDATIKPAGIAWFNVIWNHEVLWGMLSSFITGLILICVLLVVMTRALLVHELPLLATVAVVYGVVGLIGKDFDMPVAVLSTLSLGLGVDFAIHFVSRLRQRYREAPDLTAALVWTVARPGRGIVLNAVLFAVSFAAMLGASLTPYITVGVLMMAIMLLSAALSIVLLPALIRIYPRLVLAGGERK